MRAGLRQESDLEPYKFEAGMLISLLRDNILVSLWKQNLKENTRTYVV
jgi:hypothetical protein